MTASSWDQLSSQTPVEMVSLNSWISRLLRNVTYLKGKVILPEIVAPAGPCRGGLYELETWDYDIAEWGNSGSIVSWLTCPKSNDQVSPWGGEWVIFLWSNTQHSGEKSRSATLRVKKPEQVQNPGTCSRSQSKGRETHKAAAQVAAIREGQSRRAACNIEIMTVGQYYELLLQKCLTLLRLFPWIFVQARRQRLCLKSKLCCSVGLFSFLQHQHSSVL